MFIKMHCFWLMYSEITVWTHTVSTRICFNTKGRGEGITSRHMPINIQSHCSGKYRQCWAVQQQWLHVYKEQGKLKKKNKVKREKKLIYAGPSQTDGKSHTARRSTEWISGFLFVRLAMKQWLENQTNIIEWSSWTSSKPLRLTLSLGIGLKNTEQ